MLRMSPAAPQSHLSSYASPTIADTYKYVRNIDDHGNSSTLEKIAKYDLKTMKTRSSLSGALTSALLQAMLVQQQQGKPSSSLHHLSVPWELIRGGSHTDRLWAVWIAYQPSWLKM